jgi:hypothetical protein
MPSMMAAIMAAELQLSCIGSAQVTHTGYPHMMLPQTWQAACTLLQAQLHSSLPAEHQKSPAHPSLSATIPGFTRWRGILWSTVTWRW